MAVSKIWNGSSWITGIWKVWSGSAWIAKPHYWNGSAWIELFPSALVEGVDVTRASIGGSFGYGDGVGGSISPNPFLVNGNSLEGITASAFNGWDLRVILAGTLPQDHFTKVVVENEASAEETYLTSAATRTTLGGDTLWTWGTGTDPVWTNSGGVRTATFTTE